MTYVWTPTPEYVTEANVSRLASLCGVSGIDALRIFSTSDIGRFWDLVIRDLGLVFGEPYTTVLDTSDGIADPKWFAGARLNIVDSCLTRWATGEPGSRAAVRYENETGQQRHLTYAQLAQEVAAAAAGLAALGVRKGDRVAMYLPMVPEFVVTTYAVASLGAVLVPLFSGFAAPAIAARLQDSQAKVVVVADVAVRRGKRVPMRAGLAEALVGIDVQPHVVVVENAEPVTTGAGETAWTQLIDTRRTAAPRELLTDDEPFLLGYTSGTTGKPKGAVHTHAGFLLKTASELAYSFDVKQDSVVTWITDPGWVMGPLTVVGTHANGATLVLYDGSLDVPDKNRLWELVAQQHITTLGVSPTLIRTLRQEVAVGAADLSSVHVLGSTGEPWDEDTYDWLAGEVFDGRVPVINFSGGTEVGGSLLAPYPIEPIASCSVGGPSLGMDVAVYDNNGTAVVDQIGELVCRQPWPSMTRGIWNDRQRYYAEYWSYFPGAWRHGDFAMVDSEGQWFIVGRSDDVMNVAGKRLGSAELENVVMEHPGIAECAAVGIPDPTKGEVPWIFWVPSSADQDDVSAEVKAAVARQLGKPFTPAVVRRVRSLPKTTSGKVMRRAIRAAVTDQALGDMTGAAADLDLAELSGSTASPGPGAAIR